MAQWFVDSASITNLEITSSYIGSGSTSFDKENSFLFINNGLRQGINNTNFDTSTGTSNHVEGFSNSSAHSYTHIEGSNHPNPAQNFNGGHVEGFSNSGRLNHSHVEGANNNLSTDSVIVVQSANHVEGGNNYYSGGRRASHIEGFFNTGNMGVLNSIHIAGINNTPLLSVQASYSHIRGYNNAATIGGERQHIEGTDHVVLQGVGNHVEGYKHSIIHSGFTNFGGNHVEGANHIITQSFVNHINGVSCSVGLNIDGYSGTTYSFVSGLGLKTYYPTGSYAYLGGQFNSFNDYSNLGPTTNKVYTSFTIGGGLNDNTRATIFEVALIASSSAISTNTTRSIVMPWVSQSGDFIDDVNAASGGVPLGGFYRTGNNLKIRLS